MSDQHSATGAPARPLVVTDDAALLDDLLRLAAAAGVEPFVAADAAAARAHWLTAPLVVAGVDQCSALVQSRAARRDAVVVAGKTAADSVFEQAIALGAQRVALLPEAEGWLVDAFADAVDGAGHGACVAVVGGRGGAGATSTAVALAVTALRMRLRTMLVDADPWGGGVDLVLGGETAPGLRWSQLSAARGRVTATALSEALPRVAELTVLSFDRSEIAPVAPDAMATLLPAGLRGHDLVVVDLPRQLDAAAEVAAQLAAVCLLVVPAEVRATVAATTIARRLRSHCADVRVVVRGPAPSGLTGGDVAETLGLALAGELRPEPRLAADLERGDPPAARGRGPLAEFSGRFLTELMAAAQLRRRAA